MSLTCMWYMITLVIITLLFGGKTTNQNCSRSDKQNAKACKDFTIKQVINIYTGVIEDQVTYKTCDNGIEVENFLCSTHRVQGYFTGNCTKDCCQSKDFSFMLNNLWQP